MEGYQLSREALSRINRPPEGPVPPTPLPPIPAELSPMPKALPTIPAVARLEPSPDISSGLELEIHFEMDADAPAAPPRPHLV